MVLLPGAKFLPELREPLYRGDRRNKNEWNAQGRACNTLVCPQACKGLDDGSLVSEPALTRPIYHVEVARPRPVFFFCGLCSFSFFQIKETSLLLGSYSRKKESTTQSEDYAVGGQKDPPFYSSFTLK
jgi:hypothetical protein